MLHYSVSSSSMWKSWIFPPKDYSVIIDNRGALGVSHCKREALQSAKLTLEESRSLELTRAQLPCRATWVDECRNNLKSSTPTWPSRAFAYQSSRVLLIKGISNVHLSSSRFALAEYVKLSRCCISILASYLMHHLLFTCNKFPPTSWKRFSRLDFLLFRLL